jgi:hypothetical protein
VLSYQTRQASKGAFDVWRRWCPLWVKSDLSAT